MYDSLHVVAHFRDTTVCQLQYCGHNVTFVGIAPVGVGTVGIALVGIALVGIAPVGIGTCTRVS